VPQNWLPCVISRSAHEHVDAEEAGIAVDGLHHPRVDVDIVALEVEVEARAGLDVQAGCRASVGGMVEGAVNEDPHVEAGRDLDAGVSGEGQVVEVHVGGDLGHARAVALVTHGRRHASRRADRRHRNRGGEVAQDAVDVPVGCEGDDVSRIGPGADQDVTPDVRVADDLAVAGPGLVRGNEGGNASGGRHAVLVAKDL
jgi:hypothetical protein